METPREIEQTGEPIDPIFVERFAAATRSESRGGIPPTFLTRYRQTEYRILNDLRVNWKYLLHADQEYEYFEPLPSGAAPLMRSRLVEHKERKRQSERMQFIKIETEYFFSDRRTALSRSTFLIREPLTAEGGE